MANKPLKLLAGLGLGAVVLYHLDPQRSERNRVALGRRRKRRPRRVSANDVRLIARVRAELGHTVDHPRGIQVSAEDGCVTLRGAVAPDERDTAGERAASVPGVRRVHNQLIAQSER